MNWIADQLCLPTCFVRVARVDAICLSACSVSLSVCVSACFVCVCLSALSVCLAVYLSACFSVSLVV